MGQQTIFFFIFTAIQCAEPYNLETRLPLFKFGDQESKFGFSVALHRLASNETPGADGTLLIVGAPKAPYLIEDIPALSSDKIPKNPGAVYSCQLNTNPYDCRRLSVAYEGNTFDSNRNITHTEDDQWLGVSVKSQGPGKLLVACAHRSGERIALNSNIKEMERLCGKCYLFKESGGNMVQIPKNSPEIPKPFLFSICDMYESRTKNRYYEGKYYFGYSQFGSSISINGDRYILGAPGVYGWAGGIYSASLPSGVSSERNEIHQSPTCTPLETNENENGIAICDNFPLSRDAYMGFSVDSSSTVDTDSDTLYYAAGAPRGNNTGAVVFFRRYIEGVDAPTTELRKSFYVADRAKTVHGSGIVSSFGYSIVFTDLNSDGLDDLIVGAPQYYESSKTRKAGGAVYVYLNEDGKDYGEIEPVVFYGREDSHFGHSVAAIGDIDQDGFKDFAVGAPYERNGAVYIYRGGENEPKKSQVIRASDYSFVKDDFQKIVGFGASLSGNVDTDANKYPDLLIGTLSDTVALLRTRPIISVYGNLMILIEELDLRNKNCDGGTKSCFEITTCMNYTARHATYDGGVTLRYRLQLDKSRAKKGKKPRMRFTDPSQTLTGVVTLPVADSDICPGGSRQVYFEEDLGEKLTPIVVEFDFQLEIPEVERERAGAPLFDMIKDPILDADLPNVFNKKVKIKNNCGVDHVCQSNLKVDASMDEEIIIGDDKRSIITISVENTGEEAHQAYLEIDLPSTVRFYDAKISDPPSLPEMRCYSGVLSSVRCDLGNPYEKGMKDTILVSLDTTGLDPNTKKIDVSVKGYTTSRNKKILSPIQLQALVFVDMRMEFSGRGDPELVRYRKKEILGESAMTTTSDIGSLLTYTYTVTNAGGQPVSGLVVDIHVPFEIFNGKWLLYPFDSDVTTGSGVLAGSCNSTNINILQMEGGEPLSSAIFSARRNKRSLRSPPAAAFLKSKFPVDHARYSLKFSCGNDYARCVKIKCELGELEPQTSTSITLQNYLWEATFLEEFTEIDLIHISSFAEISSGSGNVRFSGDSTKAKVHTTVDHEELPSDISGDAFPWWYILIGVLLVLIIYITAIIFFVKCIFVGRKRLKRGQRESEEDESKKLQDEKRPEERM